MRSIAQSHIGRLFDGVSIRFGNRAGFADLLMRSTTALVAPLIQLGRPAIGSLGAAAAHQFLSTSRRIAAIIEPAADRIDIALPDLTPADSRFALDIYAGVFTLAGRTIATRGKSVFTRPVPSRAWARELHGFTWLRHLSHAGTPLARLNARALIEDWIDLDDEKRTPALCLEPSVVAARLRSWLTHAAWLADGATPAFHQRLLAQVTQDFRHLRRSHGRGGLVEISIATSLVAASIAIPTFRRFLTSGIRQLDRQLKRQILTDGGHVSRNPGAILDILADLLPLRAAFSHAGVPASSIMMNSIDRMLPLLRFFMHAQGTIAQFNGASPAPVGLIKAVLAADDTNGRAHGNASHSGYQRLEAIGTTIIMDCGTPPPPAYRECAHAGALSFEFSSPSNRIVINCGTSPSARAEWRAVARETAAHSTVVIGGTSSATPIETGALAYVTGSTLLNGPTELHVERREHAGATAVGASHNGYAAAYNLIHERTLRLSSTGDRLDGRDILMPSFDGPAAAVDYTARFHLDPAIQPVLLANGVVMLIAADGEAWEFHADDATPTLEDSVYLADPTGPVPTRQIVLAAKLPEAVEQRWTFVRTRNAALAATDAQVRDEPTPMV
jgi:uncharacterized heparinase superfamily protein